jgi:hypothetical protein
MFDFKIEMLVSFFIVAGVCVIEHEFVSAPKTRQTAVTSRILVALFITISLIFQKYFATYGNAIT